MLPSSAAAGNSGERDRDLPVGSAAREGTQLLQSVPYLVLNECFGMQLFQTMDLSALQFFIFPVLISSFGWEGLRKVP